MAEAGINLSLSWDAYQKNICSGLSLLQQHGEYVDMTLAADGHHVKVHQMVVSLVSPYIKDLISTAQCPHPVIFLNNISYTTLSSILEYIYTGEVCVPKERLSDLIAAAKALHIKGLKEMDDTNSTQSDSPDDPILELSTSKKTLFENLQEKQKSLQPIHKVFVDVNIEQTMNKVEEPKQISETSSTKGEEKSETKRSRINSLQTIKVKESSSSLNNVQYSISNQGGLQLIANRYIYSLKYVQKELVKFWRCTDSSYRRCPANIYTNDKNQIIRRKFTHTHPFHDAKILKKIRLGHIFAAYNEAVSEARVRQVDPNIPVPGSSLQDTDSE